MVVRIHPWVLGDLQFAICDLRLKTARAMTRYSVQLQIANCKLQIANPTRSRLLIGFGGLILSQENEGSSPSESTAVFVKNASVV